MSAFTSEQQAVINTIVEGRLGKERARHKSEVRKLKDEIRRLERQLAQRRRWWWPWRTTEA